MTNMLNANKVIDQVSMLDLLTKLGFKPTLYLGNEILFHGVFNLTDKNIRNAFSINNDLGVWFDKGLGRGGNIIDFGTIFWKNPSIDEVILKIGKVCFNTAKQIQVNQSGRKRRATKIPNYHIKEIRPIGLNPQICSYLHAEGLFDISNPYLKEVYYYVTDEKGTRKDFFSAGWQNENGGWEVRSRYYTGCIGRRGISFIEGNVKSLNLFKNFKDYFNWQSKSKPTDSSILILNSLEFLNAAAYRASKFNSVLTHFSSDELTAKFLIEVNKFKKE